PDGELCSTFVLTWKWRTSRVTDRTAHQSAATHPIQAKEASRVRDRRVSWRGKREELALALTAAIPAFRSFPQPTSVCLARSRGARRWRPVGGGATGSCEAPRPSR